MARLEIEIGAVNDELKKILQDSKIALNQFQKEVGGGKVSLGGLTQVSKETKTALEQQAIAQEKAKTATQQARQASAELTLANRQNKGSVDAAAGSYREAQNRLTALGKSIREAKGGFDSTNPAIRAQISEYNKLNTKLKEFDKAMGNNYRNVGNYSSALTDAIPMLGQFSTAAGIASAAIAVFGKSFSTNLKLDSLMTALRQVSGDTSNFETNISFLRDASERLGLDIISTSEAFKMWQGAAKFSNLTAEESRRIFESVANASAKMKLSSDDTKGAFLALSQMMSKGKVQAEELRGQLGERLPGAFALASRAMGVTEQELNKMLETGRVVASDFLPKFATELDRSFGNDKTQRIESMQASVNRLGNAFNDLWQSERATAFFTSLTDGLTDLTNKLNKTTSSSSWEEFWLRVSSLSTAPIEYLIGTNATGEEADKVRKAVEQANKEVGKGVSNFYGMGNLQSLSDYVEANKNLASSIKDVAKNQEALNNSTKSAKVSRKTVKSIDDLLPSLQGNDGNYYDQQLAKINSEYSKLVNTINESAGSKAKISQALGLAEAKRDFDTLKVSVDKFIDSTKGLKTQKGAPPLSGSLADPTQFSPTEWERLRLGGRNYTTKKEDKEQEEKFSKIIERSLRGGINDILDDIGDLGSNFYEVFSNVFTKLTKPFQSIFSGILSQQLSGLVSGSMDNAQLFGMSNDKTKALVAGVGALGGIVSGVFKKDTGAQVIGGALSGGAAGFSVGGPWGAAVGAVVGALGGLFSAKASKRQEKLQEAQLEEQKKQTALQQRMAALTFSSSIVGMQTAQGIVTSVDRNEFGDITFRVEGRDLVASMNREQEAQKRGL